MITFRKDILSEMNCPIQKMVRFEENIDSDSILPTR